MIDLFKKPLIPAFVDAAWTDDIPALANLSSSPMAVLSRLFSAGSKEETTLTNMLKACGFEAGAVTIIQVDERDVLSWSRVRNEVQPTYALLLGVPPTQLGIFAQLPANAPVEFGGVTFIWMATIQHLTATEAARKSLWTEVLQPLFKKA